MAQITRQLAEFLAGARDATLEPPVIEKAKHHIVDTVAAMVSGTALHVGERAPRLAAARLTNGCQRVPLLQRGRATRGKLAICAPHP